MAGSYRFGRVQVRPIERQVLIDGRPSPLGARAFDVLLALIERRGRMVSKGELLDIVWPGLVVEENNLQVQVSTLRKLLGSNALATIPGLGYRFTLPLDEAPGRGEAPPSRATDRPRTNVPAPPNELLGRNEDLLDLRQLSAAHRLVTVLGAGGIGKTRLALEAALGSVNEYADGVWWVDLAALPSAGQLAAAIAHAAQVKLGHGDANAQLAQALAPRDLLLVLDNCEHLVHEVAPIAHAILEAAPRLHIVATSQEALKAPGEMLFRLEPLAVPPPGTRLHKSRAYSALQLLESRARAIDRSFLLDESTIEEAIALCGRLDGIPLAIEMAAARLPVLGLATLNARLDERLRILRTPNREAPARYQTLRATLDWSYSMLQPADQAVLRRLASFAGGFRLDAAQRVSTAPGQDEWTALDALSGLVDKSLVQVEQRDPPRYRLLETTRLYGRELLAEHGEREDAERRHGNAMAAIAEEAVAAFRESPEGRCVRRYAPDYDDLAFAFDLACMRGDATVAAATGHALARIDLARGVYSSVLRRKHAAHALVEGAGPLEQARLWSCIAFARYVAFEAVPKLTAGREEVAAWRRVDDRLQTYDALCRLAAGFGTAGEQDAAESTLAEARRLEDPSWPAPVRLVFANNAAVVSAYHDDYAKYEKRARAMQAAAEDAGSERLAAVARMFLAEATFNSGDLERALGMSRAVVEEMRALDIPLGRGASLSTLCAIGLRTGDLDDFPAAALEALPFVLHHGIAGWLFDQLALHAARAGRSEQAARLLGFSDRRYAAIEEGRRPHDQRAAAEAAGAIESAIGALAHRDLRAAGAALTSGQAEHLAREVLAAA